MYSGIQSVRSGSTRVESDRALWTRLTFCAHPVPAPGSSE